jgi:glyceraldehyde 3-phosphate dehydrogenase
MSVRVAINGFGRIGRLVFRSIMAREGLEVVAVNDLSDPKTLSYLLQYDTVHGKYPGKVSFEEAMIHVGGKKVQVLAERDPAKLPWKDLKVDFVVESTGVFTKRDQIAQHLAAGAGKVVLTVPAKDEIDATVVMGVNDATLKKEHRIISNASCTTNCLAPMAKVLHDKFGIEHGLMTTVHAYTNDQVILDVIHKDPRRARAAAVNIIPTSTGAARAVTKVIPELKGRLDGMALRVPVTDGSVVDLVAKLKKPVTVQSINEAMKAAAGSGYEGIIEYCEEPIVSSDIVGNPHSCIFDAPSTMVQEGGLVKVIAWYDNEWGYSNRVVDLITSASRL